MGLIKAIKGALGGTLADQWKEFFYCDALDSETLVVKGQKKTTSRSSNTSGNDNIISNGSGIAVADGQCMIIVDQGKVAEVCAEPGEFTYNSSTEPSIFAGNLGTSIVETFKTIGKRFTYGGDTGKDQRVYYINTKEIPNNKFGTATPIPFRVVINEELGYKLSVDIRCNGMYSFRITNPLLFYTNVCGNVTEAYNRSSIQDSMKSELLTELQPALAKLSADGIQYYELPNHSKEISEALKELLTPEWTEFRGITMYRCSINSLSIPDDQRAKLTEWEENAMTTNPGTAAARLVGAQADAMKTAAGNTAGAVTGFMGMGFAGQQGGANAADLFAMGQKTAAAPADGWKCSCGAQAKGKFCPECGAKKPETRVEGEWTCECGAKNTGKFCSECGKTKPADADGWTCPKCGKLNKGKFCGECGEKKPADAKLYKCDKCGWEPADPAHPPKFCPECGDPFDDKDVVQ